MSLERITKAELIKILNKLLKANAHQNCDRRAVQKINKGGKPK